MATVVISPRRVMRFLEGGGHFWVYMQYVQGLQRLGCEVYWLEHVRGRGDPAHDAAVQADFMERMRRYGLDGKVLLYEQPKPRGERGPYAFLSMPPAQAEAILQRADLLLNFDYNIDPALLSCFRRTAMVDIDPGLLQFWMATQQLVVPAHDVYLTTGETVGTPAARFPDGGRRWQHIRPPVCLECWPVVYNPHAAAFTTVSSWWSGDWFKYGTEYYDNNKRVAFLEFVELPRRTPQPLELALWFGDKKSPERLYTEGDLEDQRLLQSYGWSVRHSRKVAGTPEDYQAYIQGSRGEFSCAKASCIKFQGAWVSDRTLCYLASGKPVVVQHTGPSAFLPNGEGMFRFTTLEDAVEALATINRGYARQCQAARALAEAYFDAKSILSTILTSAL